MFCLRTFLFCHSIKHERLSERKEKEAKKRERKAHNDKTQKAKTNKKTCLEPFELIYLINNAEITLVSGAHSVY